MNIVSREIYVDLLKKNNMTSKYITNNSPIEIYHKDDWDHCICNWQDKEKSHLSYLKFFFDAKEMSDFLCLWITSITSETFYLATIFNGVYQFRHPNNEIEENVANEFKKIFHNMNVKINTNKAIALTKKEVLRICDCFSVTGFMGMSDFSLYIPNSKMIIQPTHHMNYLLYTPELEYNKGKLKHFLTDNILIY